MGLITCGSSKREREECNTSFGFDTSLIVSVRKAFKTLLVGTCSMEKR
jgi:hypothetical protein